MARATRRRPRLTSRGRIVAGTVAVLLFVLAGALAVRAFDTEQVTQPAGATGEQPRVTTPLSSPRRAPVLVRDAAAALLLQARLDAALSPYSACAAVDDPLGPVARHEATTPLAPASTEKVLTALAALTLLGADHRFATVAVSDAPVEDGVLRGDLHLVGGGDPVLATPDFVEFLRATPRTSADPATDLDSLVRALREAGVERIDGEVIGDDSRHDTLRFLPDWKPSYRDQGQVGALGALVVNDGFVDYAARDVADDPAAHAAAQLVARLEAHGVEVTGGSGGSGDAPEGAAQVAGVESPPLSEIVAGMLTSSDNLSAETITREIGLASGGDGTTAAGAAATIAALADAGVTTEGLTLLDGSGLAPGNRATCDALVDALALARDEEFAVLDAGLAVAGETGTLALRFEGDPLERRLRAKTGQIAGVAGLAGVIDGTRPLRFALLFGGDFSQDEGQQLQADTARLLATYPDAPGLDGLVPAP